MLFSPTGKSDANPIYISLSSLNSDNDVLEKYTDNKLIEILNETEKDQEEIEDYKNSLKHIKYLKRMIILI